MKINVDDWHFQPPQDDTLAVDLYLDNGQHALLEVNAMKNSAVPNGEMPEMIVFCEASGERLTEPERAARWIARPPSRDCPWSNVSLSPTLHRQILEHLAALHHEPVC